MHQSASREPNRHQPAPAPVAYLGGRLVVDTDAAAGNLFTALGCEPGSGTAFMRVWHARAWLFGHARDQIPVAEELSGAFPPRGFQQARRDSPVGFVADVNAAGIRADLATIHFDDAEDAYVDADRAVQVLRLHEPGGFTEVCWPGRLELDRGLTRPSPDAGKVLATWVLRPGAYVLVWRFPWNRPVLHAAARIDPPPCSGEAIGDLAGFQVRRLSADCDRCGWRWAANQGDLTFDTPTGPVWQYEGASGRTGSAVDCPRTRCAGTLQLHN